jgi:hypothetical protein
LNTRSEFKFKFELRIASLDSRVALPVTFGFPQRVVSPQRRTPDVTGRPGSSPPNICSRYTSLLRAEELVCSDDDLLQVVFREPSVASTAYAGDPVLHYPTNLASFQG